MKGSAANNHQEVFLSIGSNLGGRRENLARVLSLIQGESLMVKRTSSLYETEPVGFPEQREFVNLVCEITCRCEPQQLLQLCQGLELRMGRQKDRLNGPRIIDIDIVYFGRQVIESEVLKIPHPRRMDRRFVLVPLTEIAPDFVDPVTGKTAGQMLQECRDSSWVKRLRQY